MSQSLAVSKLVYLAKNMQECIQECPSWGESAHYIKIIHNIHDNSKQGKTLY